MSIRRTVVAIAALASIVMVGVGVSAFRPTAHRYPGIAAAPDATVTSGDTVDEWADRSLPETLRVEGSSTTRESSAAEKLTAAQHRMAWLELALAEAVCERDELRAELEAQRSSGVAAPETATCNRP